MTQYLEMIQLPTQFHYTADANDIHIDWESMT